MSLLSGSDIRLKYITKSINYSHSFTLKTAPNIFHHRRYCGGIGFSVDANALKSKLIPNNDISLPYQYEGIFETKLMTSLTPKKRLKLSPQWPPQSQYSVG